MERTGRNRARAPRPLVADLSGKDTKLGTRHGQIIILNGPSSAGKTTIARALQPLLARPNLHLSEDLFFDAAEGARFFGTEAERQGALQLLSGMRGAVAAFAAAGVTMVVDVVLEERAWAEAWEAASKHFTVLKVGVHCPVAVLEARERERGDRHPGLARSHYERVHAHLAYDLQVDTSVSSPTAIARTIAARLAEHGWRSRRVTTAVDDICRSQPHDWYTS